MAEHSSSRYLTLDAMRGVATIGVAFFHIDGDAHESWLLTPHAYLGVDFFLALSGFVLTRAYQDRLRNGASLGWFVELRLIRLWPLLFAGLMIGLAHALQLTLRNADTHLTYGQIGLATALNLAFIPDFFDITLYPTNAVFWSILTELLANLAFVLVLFRLRRVGLAIVMLVATAGLALLIQPPYYGNSGPYWSGLPLGLARTLFGFAAGIAIARLTGDRVRKVSGLALLPVFLFCLIVWTPPLGAAGRIFDLVAMLVIMPLLLWLGAQWEVPVRLGWTAAFLGDVSYAFYAIHLPMAKGTAFVVTKLGLPRAAAAIPMLLVAIPLAALVVHFWDKPVRRHLSKRMALRRSAMPQTL